MEHVGLNIQHRHESTFGGGICFDRTVSQDVFDSELGRPEFAADENRPMASQWISFGAHERYPKALNSFTKPAHSFSEDRLIDKVVVLHLVVDIAICVIASGTKLLAEKYVP